MRQLKIPLKDSAAWRKAYLEAFVDTSNEYFQRIASPRQFSDGIHHTGYLWECLRSPLRITFQRFQHEVVSHLEVFVMADDHSRDMVPGATLWPYAPYSVICFTPHELLQCLPALPEDMYIFEETLSWTLVLTHEHDHKRRICCAIGIEK